MSQTAKVHLNLVAKRNALTNAVKPVIERSSTEQLSPFILMKVIQALMNNEPLTAAVVGAVIQREQHKAQATIEQNLRNGEAHQVAQAEAAERRHKQQIHDDKVNRIVPIIHSKLAQKQFEQYAYLPVPIIEKILTKLVNLVNKEIKRLAESIEANKSADPRLIAERMIGPMKGGKSTKK